MNAIPYFIYILYFLYPFICHWIPRLFLYLDCCEWPNQPGECMTQYSHFISFEVGWYSYFLVFWQVSMPFPLMAMLVFIPNNKLQEFPFLCILTSILKNSFCFDILAIPRRVRCSLILFVNYTFLMTEHFLYYLYIHTPKSN